MDPNTNREQRFATFIIGGEKNIELAIRAEDVLEATPMRDAIQPLPAGVDHLEGYMHFRDDAIPVFNMKKRLGLTETGYAAEAKVAVVAFYGFRLGLLFDDIKDVLVVDVGAIDSVPPALRSSDSIFSDLIKLDNGRRTVELLDLKRLLGDTDTIEQLADVDQRLNQSRETVQQTYSRFVVFSSAAQDYGVPVEKVQEITFLSKIDDAFKNDSIEGAVQIRGHAIPVISAARLLQTNRQVVPVNEETRVLILNADSFRYGLIVDSVREIISIADTAILPLPRSGNGTVSGIYQRTEGNNIMLIRVETLIDRQQRELRSVARLKSADGDTSLNEKSTQSRHLITADCYLVFSIGRNFAIELNDVQEIIEPKALMELPAATGFDRRVLNLRGRIVPVINLQTFYGYQENDATQDKKLIIARNQERTIALEVDRILTICKQVQYQKTPSLNPQLSQRKDTLDRLIEFVGDTGVKEHVLVINIQAMMDNHLGMNTALASENKEIDSKENKHDNHAAE
jgi:purine-binding chemotaxis protein CheW